MKNLYALNTEDRLIHIQTVDKSLKEKFYCCNCGGQLIPRKGKMKAHHFSHKAEDNCNYETYLHKVSKIRFFEQFQECIKNKEPFYLEYKIDQECISCENLENINIKCNLGNRIGKYDLTQTFDKITIESKFNNFIADVLLSSSKTNDVIFIEFAVTHYCEEEKINNGFRIIEFGLSTDEDLQFIEDKLISVETDNINFYNLKRKIESKTYYQSNICNKPFEVFSILNDNKSWKKTIPMKEIIKDLKYKTYKHHKVLELPKNFSNTYSFPSLVQEYSFIDSSYKNCYSCRFIAENNSYMGIHPLFCKRIRCEIPNSNFGRNCDKYWRIEKTKEIEF